MSKNLGGIGAILIVIAGLGALGTIYVGLLGLVGIILVLISAKGLTDHYGEGGIFNNGLYGIVMGIIGVISLVGIVAFGVLSAIADLGIDTSDWANMGLELQQRIMEGDISFILELLGALILAWIVFSICIIIATIFARKSLNLMSAKTGTGMFGTAGILMLIGGILAVVAIGYLLIWVAWILVAVAFFSIKTQPTQPQETPKQPT
ncbi:MAG: DUF996 domain-containing protein [Candidatus Bathyarchaeota archaeon]|nr:DUF996 domain-containing protein [Candidatus Bathyarchaeota archaeon]